MTSLAWAGIEAAACFSPKPRLSRNLAAGG